MDDKAKGGKRAGIGILIIACLVMAVFVVQYLAASDTKNISKASKIGYISLSKVMSVHKDYQRFQELDREVMVMETELKAEGNLLELTTALVNKKAFDDAARQKENLERVARYSKLLDEYKEREKAVLDRLTPVFDKELQDAEAKYLNEMLNLRLKMDNAEALRLTQEQADAMLARMNEIQKERADIQRKVRTDQQKRLKAELDKETSELQAEMKKYMSEYDKDMRQYEAERLQKAQDRNNDALGGADADIKNRVRLAQKKAAVAGKKQELKVLEQHIMTDISTVAAKLAVMNHLEVILAIPSDNSASSRNPWSALDGMIVGTSGLDLTEAMIDELKEVR